MRMHLTGQTICSIKAYLLWRIRVRMLFRIVEIKLNTFQLTMLPYLVDCFHFDHFLDTLGFVALGMGFVVKIRLKIGIWAKFGLGNGIWTHPSGTSTGAPNEKILAKYLKI